MARTPAQAKALETKALAAASKSAGMRMLFEAGYSVTDVRTLFGVPYGFAYGVAQRAGVVNEAAARRAPAKAKTAPKAKTAAKAAATAKPAPRTRRTAATSTRKAKATA